MSVNTGELYDYFYFNQARERCVDKGVTLTLTMSARDDVYPDTAWFGAIMPDDGGAPLRIKWFYCPQDLDVSDIWDEVKAWGESVLGCELGRGVGYDDEL